MRYRLTGALAKRCLYTRKLAVFEESRFYHARHFRLSVHSLSRRLTISNLIQVVTMPRPRFTLRVILALAAIVDYVAWQVGMVQQRKAAMKGTHVFALDRSGTGINPTRALLGDEPIRYVYIVPLGDYQSDSARLGHLVPEAEVKPIEDRRAFD
jgi:hypothetical protein